MDRRALVPTLLLLATAACNDGGDMMMLDPGLSGVGLGGSCAERACRTGLTCSAERVCLVAQPADAGAPCVTGVECASSQCGPGMGQRGACWAEPGPGQVGTPCQGDADCGRDLRCGFDGERLFPACVSAGNRDLGVECSADRQCVQGLFCVARKCAFTPVPAAAAPRGLPPALVTPQSRWQGVSCAAARTTSPISALWVLPRESDAQDVRQDFFRLPYPNDALRDGQGRVDYSRFPKDPAPPFGFDLLGRYLDRLATEPFGNYPTVTFRFDGEYDFGSIIATGSDPLLRWVNLTDGPDFGNGRGLSYVGTWGGRANLYTCPNSISVRPGNGDSLPPGTYAVLLKRGIKARTLNTDVVASPDLLAVLAESMPTDAVLQRAWTAYAPLRRYLTQRNIPLADVVNAAVFTVGDPNRLVRELARSADATTPPVADPWVRCGSGTPSPCPDATGGRACGTSANLDEYHALVEVPIFQQGVPPYLAPDAGGDIVAATEDGGLLSPVRREKLCAALVTPRGTPPDGGWPLALYAHGTGGSFRSHAGDTSASALAQATLADGGAVPFAVLGFDQVGHGPRRGARQDVSPDDIVFNFANPASARGTLAQGAADLVSFWRYAKGLAGVTDAGIPQLNVSRLVFWGHSQGASEGGLALAFDRRVDAVVLTGASGSIIDALTTKKAPVDIAGAMWIALSESSPSAVSAFHPVLGIVAGWTDPIDAMHFARQNILVRAAPGQPAFARHFLQVWGRSDLYTSSTVQRAFALASGAELVSPEVDEFELVPVSSARGNVTSGPRPVTAAIRQFVPAGYDGHFVAFRDAQASSDVVRFLARAARGEVPRVPDN